MDINGFQLDFNDPDVSFYSDFDLNSYQDNLYTPSDHFEAGGSSDISQRAVFRVSLACIPCRTRHVKCDASTPSCSRCQSDSRTCSYAKSRRGGRRPKNPRQGTLDTSMPRDSDASESLQHRPVSNSAPTPFSESATPETSETSETSGNLGSFQAGGCSSKQLLDLYYRNFHDAHPVVLPQRYLLERLQSDPASLTHLVPVMEYIGSLYLPHVTSENFREQASSGIVTCNLPMSGFSVQALMLFAVATHCRNSFEEARVLLDEAISIALAIQMQSISFARDCGEGSAVVEESWRRTWWLLFVIDGVFAGIRHEASFKLFSIETDVDLPCEEHEYATGTIPTPRTLIEYSTREFAEEEIIFSSFAYLIDAGRIIGTVLAISPDVREPFDPTVISADARLINWFAHLPKRKKEMIEECGRMDEMIFQAHIVINTLKIYLHRPRSKLAYSAAEGVSRCTPAPLLEQMLTLIQNAYAFHTRKTLEAIETLLGMLALPTPFIKHTPLIICGLAMAIMGQISACNLVLEGKKCTEARDRILLGLGVLKAFVEVWPLGNKTSSDMKAIARELLSTPDSNGSQRSQTRTQVSENDFTSALINDQFEGIGDPQNMVSLNTTFRT